MNCVPLLYQYVYCIFHCCTILLLVTEDVKIQNTEYRLDHFYSSPTRLKNCKSELDEILAPCRSKTSETFTNFDHKMLHNFWCMSAAARCQLMENICLRQLISQLTVSP